MMVSRTLIVGTTAQSLLTLLGIQETMRGRAQVLVETPAANALPMNWGTKAEQPMVLAATGDRLQLKTASLKDLYFLGGNATDVINVCVFREVE